MRRSVQVDPDHLSTSHTPTGEQTLAMEVLKQAIADIRHPHPGKYTDRPHPSFAEQLETIEWLLAGDELGFFASILHLEEHWLRQQILIRVGAVDGPLRLGTSREPPPTRTRLYSPEPPVHPRSTQGPHTPRVPRRRGLDRLFHPTTRRPKRLTVAAQYAAEAQRLHAQGQSIIGIARHLRLSRNTVKKALRMAVPSHEHERTSL